MELIHGDILAAMKNVKVIILEVMLNYEKT